jgi:DNA-binding protein HU-beta
MATKRDIIDGVAAALEMTKKDAEKVTNEVFNQVIEAVVRDGKVQITDFLTVESKQMEARQGRNPQTGEEITIAARKQLFAKFGEGFKSRVNGQVKEAKVAAAPAKKAPVAKAAPKAAAKKAPTAKKAVKKAK